MSWDDDSPEAVGAWSAGALREDLDDVAAALRALAPRVAGLNVRVGEAETIAARADARALAADADRRALAGQLKRLTARVEWLERNLRRASPEQLTLDDVPAELRRLAADAEEGGRRQDALMAESVRTTLEGVVAAHAEVVRGLVGHRRAAVAAAGTLASTGWRTPPHRAATTDFEEALAGYRTLREEVSRLAGPALEAAHDLAEDEQQQAAAAGAIESGQAAAAQLRTGLRARLEDAVETGALLPEWFVAALGPLPPSTGSEAWLEAGTELLAYRLSFAVDDPVEPLGPAPDAEFGPRRRAWYRRLHRALQQSAG